MLFMLLLVGLSFAAPVDLQQAWASYSPLVSEIGRAKVGFDDKEWRQLAAGNIVRHRVRLDGADSAMGAMWMAYPRHLVWVAIQDDEHATLVDSLFEEKLPGSTHASKLLYQRVDLPWPFIDRQWVIRVDNNIPIYTRTEGRLWERSWSLAEASRALNPTDEAIWTPVNEGGWILAEMGGGTLVIYHVRTVVSGAIPDDIATRWALSTLDELLVSVSERSATIAAHYTGSHAPIYSPDGQPIPVE